MFNEEKLENNLEIKIESKIDKVEDNIKNLSKGIIDDPLESASSRKKLKVKNNYTPDEYKVISLKTFSVGKIHAKKGEELILSKENYERFKKFLVVV